uniref:Glucose-1-phosphate thymidylyltransferase n=1 Tax=Salinispora pacifica TaxID=351187 RepID=S4WI56_SALPI|nr:glucose-1-phosphate thymidylyltransferase [Salinispora pacifica]
MKALVLAGGSGTRLRPFSYSIPKQLIPVANRPVLEHVLANIATLGVTEVGIIVGDWGERIREAVGDGSRHGLRITYLRQAFPGGLAHAVQVARPFLGGDDFVMQLGDNLLADSIAELAAGFRRNRPDAEVVVHKVADPRQFGVVELDPSGAPRRLVEKPAQPRSDLALVGIYFFTAAVHAAVDAIQPSARGELEITDAVQWLVDHDARVRVSEYDGYWKDVGRVDDVLDCNRYLLAAVRPEVAGQVDAASLVDRNVVVEPGARIVRSRIEGPTVIGADSLIVDSQLGPYSAIGSRCELRRVELGDSIVLDGAQLTAVRNLRRSMVGRGATVTGGRSGPGSRVLIGDDARVEVAA